mgnify:CR=1 FL=1
MPEKILVLDNSTFFVICHAAAEDEKIYEMHRTCIGFC